MAAPKIDVHHHIIPPQFANYDHGMKDMKPVKWTYEDDVAFCKDAGVETRIFSVTAPGVTYIKDADESAAAARSMNEFCRNLRDKDPHGCGFFATIPSLTSTEHAVTEIVYALDHLSADGISLFTSYAGQYLGHGDFVPIWEELDARHAVVFVHPGNNETNANALNELLPAPAFDWPHETGRAAMDMILRRRLEQFPNVKIILSHAGGTLPLLIQRSTLISFPEFGQRHSADYLYQHAKKFYFDTALSAGAETLPLILGFAERGHLLYGSDYPYAPTKFIKQFNGFLDTFPIDNQVRNDIYSGAAYALFPRLKRKP